MELSTSAIFGIVAAVVNFVAFIPYIVSILKRKTKPERSSWWIWTILMTVALFAQIAAGGAWSVLLTVVFVIGNLIVAILSLKYGYGSFNNRNKTSLLITFAALVVWYITESPILALLITIAVDFLAYWLTIIKSWKAPYTENILTWSLMAIAAVLTTVSVGSLDFALIVFPLYVAIVSFIGVYVLYYRRKWRSSRIKDGIANKKL